ncbi:MarR family winged helix-turn-helix transcriptional regulator [Pleomorphomonas sp. NRK KF1]|uniref:MarR family winged helix-turn-helix transcriptional regulator n=1 Tax=Pleomorphomonas sp. NRK KF1 TaxID=2943000 RepID=UPI00204315A1|nr:MarR family transcriptional regulator [Pleomorphomonas sp. NRK KF1]MCM5551835.1 MarR family transcriptional regulator [Pleomorphomonas sp. NRK KF1]
MDTDIIDGLSDVVFDFYVRLRADAVFQDSHTAPFEARLLAMIEQAPGITQQHLIIRTNRDKAQIARLIKAMGEKGLIQRVPDSKDRRVSRLYLTTDGRALHAAVRKRRTMLLEDMLSEFASTELESVNTFIEKWRERFTERVADQTAVAPR